MGYPWKSMMGRARTDWPLWLLALAGLGASGASAQEKVRIGVGSFNLNNAPYYVALGLNEFDKEGLQVQESHAASGAATLQSVLAGSTDVAVGFYDHTIQLQARNKDLVAFVNLARNSGLVLAVGNNWADKIGDLKALAAHARELKIGITSPGSSSDFFIRYVLQSHGVSPVGLNLVAVGSGQAAVAALKQSQIDVLVNYDPAATLLTRMKSGTILVDARTDRGAQAVYGGIYPTSSMYATGEFLRSKPELAQKIANALLRTLAWMGNHTPAEIAAAIPAQYKSGDGDTYVEALGKSKGLFSKDGRFVAADLETTYQVLRSFNDQVKLHPVDLKKTYTNEFVKAAARPGRRADKP